MFCLWSFITVGLFFLGAKSFDHTSHHHHYHRLLQRLLFCLLSIATCVFFVEWGRWGSSPPAIAAPFAAMTYLVPFFFPLVVAPFCSAFRVVLWLSNTPVVLKHEGCLCSLFFARVYHRTDSRAVYFVLFVIRGGYPHFLQQRQALYAAVLHTLNCGRPSPWWPT